MNVATTKFRLRDLGIQLAAETVRGSAHKDNEDFFAYLPCGNGIRLVVADEISHKVGVAATEPGRIVLDALRDTVDRLADDALEVANASLSQWLEGQGTRAAAGVCIAIADIQQDERGHRTLDVFSVGDISVFVRRANPLPFRPAFRRLVEPQLTVAGSPAVYLGRPGKLDIHSAKMRLRRGDMVMLASDGGLGGVADDIIGNLLAAYARNPLARLGQVLSFLQAEATLNNISDDRTVALVAVE